MTTSTRPTAAPMPTAPTTVAWPGPGSRLVGRPTQPSDPGCDPWQDEDGSLVSEYGLIAVLGATITGVAISWAKGGAIATLLNVVLRQVRALAGV